MKFTASLSALILSVSTIALTANAQQTEKDSILVLDASGSMWGQIDGVNKIVIAKDVVEGLVRTLPEERRLGLVAYGHRKGDCGDIQTLADVGGNRKDMISKIRSINPKGKTPLSKSVEHAATELDYTKNAATVILVSDGLETCDVDPCALAKTLEEYGLDFTVHVVGFDVTEQERKGLVCIAEETGGLFIAADNADELSNALTQVAMPTPPKGEPVPASLPVALKATILRNGPEIQSKLDWEITKADNGETVFSADDTGYADTELPPGDYTANAVWHGWQSGEEKTGSTPFTVTGVRAEIVTVPIDLGLPVSLEGPAEAPEGVAFDVTWSGPDDLGAYVSINALDDGPREHIYFFPAQKTRDRLASKAKDKATLDTDGDGGFDQDDMATAPIGAPSTQGDYELRYVLAKPRLILARKPIKITDNNYSLSAPKTVPVASKFTVEWKGKLTDGDFLTIIEKGSNKAFHNGMTTKLKDGQSAELTAFAEPGEYEVRYILANGYTTYPDTQYAVQASVPITVTDVTADFTSPASAVGGSTIRVEITPPDGWNDDYMSIIEPGAVKANRDSVTYFSRDKTDPGKAVEIRVPAISGDYELAYFLNPGNKVLKRQPITISPAVASVDAPASVKAGTDFQVNYSGDAFSGDRIIICPEDTPDHKMWSWGANYGFFVKPGETEGTVRGGYKATVKPGKYEARYVTGLQHQVLARDKFTVTE